MAVQQMVNRHQMAKQLLVEVEVCVKAQGVKRPAEPM